MNFVFVPVWWRIFIDASPVASEEFFMKKAPYYVPLVVREYAKQKALTLIGEGYIQAREVLACPLCRTKYFFLCDARDSGRAAPVTRRHEEALLYFAEKIVASHEGGHIEDVLVLPYELHMISSAPDSGELSRKPRAC
jgi:hypothetical protein